MAEEDYCDCNYFDDPPPDFYAVSYPKAQKQYKCDECGGPIFPKEKYRRIVGRWDGGFYMFRECGLCSELREWAVISKPCFCAYEFGSLHERVKLMVDDIAPIVEGFQEEYDSRMSTFAFRRTLT